MTTLSAAVRRQAERSTLELPFLIPAKEWFSVKQAAQIIGLSARFVEKLYDQGTQLSGHNHNAGKGARTTKRIPRVWIVTYLATTAQYDDQAIDDAIVAALRHRPAASLLRISSAATRLITERPHSRQQ